VRSRHSASDVIRSFARSLERLLHVRAASVSQPVIAVTVGMVTYAA
jgi:hypothetical protein